MMQHTVAQGFIRAENNAQLFADTTLDGLLAQMQSFHRWTAMLG
jgi:hypothetical protein